jgi:hypothetical protein
MACRMYGLTLQLELLVCFQGCLSYLVMISSAFPTHPRMGLELLAAFLLLQFLCDFSTILLPLLLFLMLVLFVSLQNIVSSVLSDSSLFRESKQWMFLIHILPCFSSSCFKFFMSILTF